MPASMAPKPEANTQTTDVVPDGWDKDGPKREYFTILTYTDPSVLKAATDAARKTSTTGGKPSEDQDAAIFRHHLFTAQLKGWRLLVAPDTDVAAYKDRIEEHNGYLFWRFTPQNVADLPWGVAAWLANEIMNRDGGMPTSALITKANDGTLLTFRGTPQGVVPGKVS